MSSNAMDMNMPAARRSISSITTTTMSRTPSVIHPLTRVSNRTTIPPLSLSPTNSPVQEADTSLDHTKNQDTPQLEHLPRRKYPPLRLRANIPHLRLPAGVDPDEEDDEQDDGDEDWDLDLVTLAICTVDSMEIIRRNTEEKKWRGSDKSRNGKTVIRDFKRAMERMRASVRNGVMSWVRRFSS